MVLFCDSDGECESSTKGYHPPACPILRNIPQLRTTQLLRKNHEGSSRNLDRLGNVACWIFGWFESVDHVRETWSEHVEVAISDKHKRSVAPRSGRRYRLLLHRCEYWEKSTNI